MLGGHKAGIIDIKIHVERRFVFSYGKDAVIKLWDLDKATIIQTIGLHFPSFSVLGKEIEFGRPGMYIETGTPDVILVICCEHMTELRLLEERYSSQEVGLLAAPDEVCWPDNTIQRYTNGNQSITSHKTNFLTTYVGFMLCKNIHFLSYIITLVHYHFFPHG